MSKGVSRPRGPRDRPPGYAPRRTSLGLFGLLMLSASTPMADLTWAAPFIHGGVDIMIGGIPYVMALAMMPTFVLVAGLRQRRYWFICVYFYFGIFQLVFYTLSLSIAVISLLGVFPIREVGYGVMSPLGVIYLLASLPFAWFLLRALRLRYWQPGSAPETWEPGDELPPAWAMSPSRRNRP